MPIRTVICAEEEIFEAFTALTEYNVDALAEEGLPLTVPVPESIESPAGRLGLTVKLDSGPSVTVGVMFGIAAPE